MTTNSRSPHSVAALAAAGLLALAACSGDAGATAEALIETELAEQLGLGDLDATCNQPEKLEEGQEFDCTATTPEGAEIALDARFVSDDRFEVWAINAIPGTSLSAIEADVAAVIGADSGIDIPTENVDCGSESLILADDNSFTCELTDPTDGAVYEMIATTDGYDGEILVNLIYNVGEQIR